MSSSLSYPSLIEKRLLQPAELTAELTTDMTILLISSADPEGGGQGVRTPPGKSQVIWVSIGDKQLDPPWKKLDPPPPPTLENVGPPLERKMIVFFEINHLTSVK